MSENCVELASLVRFSIVDTLKKSAPGISETMREAIASSVMVKLRAQAPSAFPQELEPREMRSDSRIAELEAELFSARQALLTEGMARDAAEIPPPTQQRAPSK